VSEPPEVESEERAAEIAASTVFEPDLPAATEPEVVPEAEPEIAPDAEAVGAPEVSA
jgi:hypothetical protein